MSYFKTWEKLKLTFEKDSGRKKPGDTFMGVFRKPSGIEETTKKLDDAIKMPMKPRSKRPKRNLS